MEWKTPPKLTLFSNVACTNKLNGNASWKYVYDKT